jgi:acyl-CoA synthetase (AMP-forming)/AMP-acid ligase II
MGSARQRLLGFGRYGARGAILTEQRGVSFGQLDDLAARWAGRLVRWGVRVGDTVVAIAGADLPVVAAMLGAYRLGAVFVPVHARYRRAEIEHVVRDSGARVVLHGPELEAEIPAIEGVHVHTLGDVSADAGVPAVQLDDEATALLVYTSGTTGKSKGVELSYRALVEATEGLAGAWEWSEEDTLSLQLPLHHVHGLVVGIHCALLRGVRVRLHPRFSAQQVVDDIRHGATIFMGVPTMYTRLLRHLETHPDDAPILARARLFTAGSAALPAEDLRRFEALTGHRIVERYGMTETLITLSNPLHGERRPGSVGLPLPGVRLRVVDDDGTPVPDGDPGELQVQGPGLMTGYRGRPDDTAAAFEGPWFRTGDVVVREPDGYLRIVGRRSVDIIKSGGFKIGAREIEDVLATHPLVAEVAVFGVPDPEWGEAITAAVVPTCDVTEPELLAALQAHCAGALVDYKKPRRVLVLPELPRNAMGKVMKTELKVGLAVLGVDERTT